MNEFGEGCVTAIIMMVLALVFALILCYPMMLLWNCLMPVIFGLPTITFWQMFGLQILFNFLFKSSHTNVNNKK